MTRIIMSINRTWFFFSWILTKASHISLLIFPSDFFLLVLGFSVLFCTCIHSVLIRVLLTSQVASWVYWMQNKSINLVQWCAFNSNGLCCYSAGPELPGSITIWCVSSVLSSALGFLEKLIGLAPVPGQHWFFFFGDCLDLCWNCQPPRACVFGNAGKCERRTGRLQIHAN